MSWTIHTTHRTGEAIQIHPALPLGRETWVHIQGDPPTTWHQMMPVCRVPRHIGMSQIDAYMTKENK